MGGNSTLQLCPVTTAQNLVTKELRHPLAYTPVYFCTMKGSGHVSFSGNSSNASRCFSADFVPHTSCLGLGDFAVSKNALKQRAVLFIALFLLLSSDVPVLNWKMSWCVMCLRKLSRTGS